MCIMASQNGILIQSIADILHLLQDGYALAPGGRDLNGRPIITFPDRNVKADFTDEEFRQMLSYYTAVPPYGSPEDVARGFVIIVDRRNSSWGRVRPLLIRILHLFPAPIETLLIIAPTSLLQRFIADFKMSSIRTERMQKANMVLINAMNELQTYVCSNQLPHDLNGTHNYSHDKWIEHRMAVESLAIQEHRIARSIEELSGQSSQRTLPRAVAEVQAMLEADSEEQTRIQADLQRMLETAQTLAKSIAATFQSDLPPDRRIHLLSIERAHSRLRDAQRRFELFWSRQERHLRWGHQYAGFLEQTDQAKEELSSLSSNASNLLPERSHAAVRSAVEELQRLQDSLRSWEARLEELKERAGALEESAAPADNAEAANVPPEAPGALAERRSRCVEARQELAALDAKMAASAERLQDRDAELRMLSAAYEAMEKCSCWQANLAQLVTQKANVVDSSDARREAIGELRAALASRPALPTFSGEEDDSYPLPEDMQESLAHLRETMNSAQEEGERLVLRLDAASPGRSGRVVRRESDDPASKCVSASCLTDRDGAVELLTNGNSASGDKDDNDRRLQKRSHVMRELIETERDYVECLERIHEVFWSEIDSPSDPNLNVPKELKEDRRSLFGNWEELLQFHKNNLLLELESCAEQPGEMGRCFQDCQEKFELYSDYCLNKFYADALLTRLGGDQDPFIRHCQARLSLPLPLSSFLLKPVQRVQKYQLLLKEMLKNTPPGCEEANQLATALNTMLRILRSLNDAMLRCDIVGYQKLSSKDLGRLLLHDNFQVSVENKNERVVRSKLKERHVFLFEKNLLVCKSKLAGKNAEKVEYHFEMEMLLEQCGFTESTKASNARRFELWKDNRRVVLTLQAPTVEVKQCWTTHLQSLLLEQFKKLKEKVEMQREHGDRSSYQMLSSPSPTAKFSLLSTPSPTSPLVEKTLRSSASDDDVEVGGSRKPAVDLQLSPGPYPVTQV